eukprot:TRINITY_DN4289_c0_g3_i1.p1 TRINITY_DN4289_c0_g3~~TRINITY_DN4289_c0_g3_i1.p1  ORF type:complete len:200 (-),score=2.44 TRINITY_DN4289_c0_g3_i1:106-705(-)
MNSDNTQNRLWDNTATIIQSYTQTNIFQPTRTSLINHIAVQIFDSLKVPQISVACYINRIKMYAQCSDSCIVLALVYIDRLLQKKAISINRRNVHKLLITGVVLAIKYNEDDYYDNDYYAKVGGITCEELLLLECEMLALLNYNLYVSCSHYCYYLEKLNDCELSRQAFVLSPSEAENYNIAHKCLSESCVSTTVDILK